MALKELQIGIFTLLVRGHYFVQFVSLHFLLVFLCSVFFCVLCFELDVIFIDFL